VAELGLWPVEKRPMGVGIMIPRIIGGPNGHDPRFSDVLAICESAHRAGFDSLWFGDHFSWVEPDGTVVPRWETFTMMAAIAARVPDVLLGTMVACTGYRNSGVTAKMTEALDEISGGRIILGVGAGWNKPEYEQFGYPFDHRVSRFEEAIQIIRPLLREGRATFQGKYEQANNAVNAPKGPRPEGAPILFGSNGERMLGLLAKYGDAWNSGWISSIEEAEAPVARLHRIVSEHGRDPQTVAITASVYFSMRGEPVGKAKLFEGNVEERAALMARFHDRGFRHMITAFDHCTPETVTELGQSLPLLDATPA
jgi:alkanesulfonate monooxygenase SsuD/methylene tetrahydromethanopterin reductase-like flavin-dependent oxidoreductase (luciferase family)